MQGWRLEMEDAHILAEMPSAAKHTMLAVFDGHGGSGAAKYAAANLISVVEKSESWNAYLKEFEEGGEGAGSAELIGEALKEAFMQIDLDIRKAQDEDKDRVRDQQDLKAGGWDTDTSGCTAVVCIVNPRYIVCSNAGDSRCVMGTENTTKPLSDDHKPMNPSELTRIEAAGGYVSNNRVEGNLAVSRAFGDFEFKNSDMNPKLCKVTALPDITIHTRTNTDDILMLACDGVWDVFSSEDAVDLARAIMQEGEEDMVKLCEEVVDESLRKGSKDNISCVCLKLPGAKIGTGGGVLKRRADREAAEKAAADEAPKYTGRSKVPI